MLPGQPNRRNQPHLCLGLDPPKDLMCHLTAYARNQSRTRLALRRRHRLSRRRSPSLQSLLTFDLKPLPPSSLTMATAHSKRNLAARSILIFAGMLYRIQPLARFA